MFWNQDNLTPVDGVCDESYTSCIYGVQINKIWGVFI